MPSSNKLHQLYCTIGKSTRKKQFVSRISICDSLAAVSVFLQQFKQLDKLNNLSPIFLSNLVLLFSILTFLFLS